MSSTNDEEKQSTEPNSIHSLPDDLIVSCLARVSRLHYPIVSLVSKSFGSLLASPEVSQTRSLLNRTEKCLYVCLQFPSELNPRWFTLCKKPNQTLTKKTKEKERSGGYALAPIRILNSPVAEWSNLVAVGSNLYAIKATEEFPPCSNIPYLDCRTHTWLEAPSMRIAHTDCGFNGNLYLPGSCEKQDSSSLNCIEVFNTETQTWNHPVPPDEGLFELRNMEGKIYMKQFGVMGMAIKPKESTWELLRFDNLDQVSYCLIENVIYRYRSTDGFDWSRKSAAVARELKGLEGLPKFAGYSSVKLVDYGGNLVVLWEEDVPAREEKMIWCAEISLEKRNNGDEIWGKVEWVDAVFTVSKSYKFVYAIAATV